MTIRAVPAEHCGYETNVAIPMEGGAERLAYIKRTDEGGLHLFTSPELFSSCSNDPSFQLAKEAVATLRDNDECEEIGPYFPVPSICHMITGEYHKKPSEGGQEWFKETLVPVSPGKRKIVLNLASDEERKVLDGLVVDNFPDHVRFL